MDESIVIRNFSLYNYDIVNRIPKKYINVLIEGYKIKKRRKKKINNTAMIRS